MTSDRQLSLATRRFMVRLFDHVAAMRADGRLDDKQLAQLVVDILQSHHELKLATPRMRTLLDASATPAPEEVKELVKEDDGDDDKIIFLVVNT